MTAALAKKLSFFVGLYLFASLAIFAAIDAVPGDPIASRFGKAIDPARVALERERLGLDESWPIRYLISQQQFLAGDWGRSLTTGRETLEDLQRFMPATVELSLSALALGVAVGLSVALAAALGAHPWLTRLAQGIGSIGLIVPIFWIGILLLVVGAWWLGWFPMGGRSDLAIGERGFVEVLRYLALPTACLSFFPMASVATVTFARLQEPELQAFVAALRSRGYGPWRIVWRHLLRIAAAPTITVVGTSFGALLGGAFMTETVFSWPGIGRYLVSAILGRDLFVAQNVLTFLVLLVIAVAFVADLVVWKLDPKKGGEES